MRSIFQPWTIHEADAALYLANPDGITVSQAAVFLGGHAEEIQIETRFEKHRLDRHGEAFGNIYHRDEEHAISIESFFVMERSTSRVAHVRRNQKYILVLRWIDDFTGAWCKHVYFGVTADGRRLAHSSEAFLQNLDFDARWVSETEGRLNPPSMDPDFTGVVRYVNDGDSVDLYSYDFSSGEFSVIDAALLSGRAQIVESSGQWKLVIDGEDALILLSGELRAEEFTAVGGTFPAIQPAIPRVEFWRGPNRLAAVTKGGELAVPSLEQVLANPNDEEGFALKVDGSWAATIGFAKTSALAFTET